MCTFVKSSLCENAGDATGDRGFDHDGVGRLIEGALLQKRDSRQLQLSASRANQNSQKQATRKWDAMEFPPNPE